MVAVLAMNWIIADEPDPEYETDPVLLIDPWTEYVPFFAKLQEVNEHDESGILKYSDIVWEASIFWFDVPVF